MSVQDDSSGHSDVDIHGHESSDSSGTFQNRVCIFCSSFENDWELFLTDLMEISGLFRI